MRGRGDGFQAGGALRERRRAKRAAALTASASRWRARRSALERHDAGAAAAPLAADRSRARLLLTAAPLRIDERILHFLAGINLLDARLQPLLEDRDAPRADGRAAAGARRNDRATWERAAPPLPPIHLAGDDAGGAEESPRRRRAARPPDAWWCAPRIFRPAPRSSTASPPCGSAKPRCCRRRCSSSAATRAAPRVAALVERLQAPLLIAAASRCALRRATSHP